MPVLYFDKLSVQRDLLKMMSALKIFFLNVKPKFYVTGKLIKKPRTILDLGIANKSYSETKMMFPGAVYHGVDYIDQGVNLSREDKFLKFDLERDFEGLSLLGEYDLIIANHVLEHLENGEQVYDILCGRLSPGGVLYAEFPSIKTARRSKTRGSYHFHDDKTHKRFYSLKILANLAMDRGCNVVSCGPVSTPLKNIASIPRAIISALMGRGYGPSLLHFSGKIDHIFVQKRVGDSR